MYDLRQTKKIDLTGSTCLKEKTTYKFIERTIEKEFIAKFISYYEDTDDNYLIAEFRKLAILSGEPEIATVYYIATSEIDGENKSCYIMEYVKGQSLNDFLNNRNSIIYEVLLDLILQLALGLEKAHNFGIFHNDLHNDNILINEFGYLKIIDFQWYNYKNPNPDKDLTDFKRVVKEFEQKCKDSDTNRFQLISKYCNSITTVKGLSKEIKLLDEISFELSLIDNTSLNILSKLFELTVLNKIKMAIESKHQPIPKEHIPELDEKERGYLEKNKSNSIRLRYSDSNRIRKIEANLRNLFNPKLFSLGQLNLIDWEIWVLNSGDPFVGPYNYNFRILFTSNFLKFKKVNDLIPFVDINQKTLEELLIE